MCIAILNKYEKLSEETLTNSWHANKDGAGLLYTDGKKLYSFKELNSLKRFIKKYNEVRQLTNFPILVHFRIATSGKINENNCHPFITSPKLGFIHNGMIDIHSDNNFSDTFYFNKLLSSLPKDFIFNESIRELIGGYINSSKLVFLTNEGEYFIINEELGHWDHNGNWYSNNSYKRKKYERYSYFDYSQYYSDSSEEKEESEETQSLDNCICDSCLNNVSHIVYNYEGYDLCGNCYNDYIELIEDYE